MGQSVGESVGESMGSSVRRSARRRAAAGAGLAAVALAGGAVGCSKGTAEESPKMTPAAAVAKAAKNADDIKSFRYRMTGKVPGEGRIKAEASMRVKPSIAMSMKMTALDRAKDGTAEIRFVDKTLYVGGNAAAAKEMNGKSWLKIDAAAVGGGAVDNNTYGVLPRGSEGNPAAQSTILAGSKDLEKAGTETIDGTRTAHYRGTVTSRDLMSARDDSTDKKTRERLVKSLDQFMALGVDKLTMDVWIDGDDHTKQFRVRGDADKGALDMTFTFLDFNQPVTVTAPPAKDTVDVAEMVEEARG